MPSTPTPSSLHLTPHTIPTTHGTIHVLDTGTPSPSPSPLPTLLLLHGNSSHSHIFLPLIALSRSSPSLQRHRILALDLPGHGASSDAPDEKSYTQPAYGDAALQVLEALGVGDVVVLGWSLGGHNAIEMVAQLEEAASEGGGGKRSGSGVRVRGIMITGTPPSLGLEQTQRGFFLGGGAEGEKKNEKGGEGKEGGDEEGEGGEHAHQHDQHVNLAGTEHWSARDFDTFPFEAARGERAPWIRAAAVRTDGRARRVMFDAFEAGRGADQVRVVAETAVPCAVVNGADEPFVNLDYLDELAYGNLWEGRCHRLPGLGHAPFWEQPEAFLPYWERFVRDCSGGSSGEA
ncbi:hypothetical protein SLS54_004576 [Diplodia seriata]